MQYQVLARKWRPHNFTEIVGQPQIVRALSNALNRQQLHHAYLFTGTRGVGKTTIARIIAKCLNCEKGVSAEPCGQCETCQEIESGRFPDLYEVDAASRTKVEDTRELLDNVQYATTKGRYKVYLIDEVHMLSGHSFNALLKTLEEPPLHVKFLLATTDYQKLPATVLSRCLQFHLKQMPATTIAEYLQKVLLEEKINFEIPATLLIGKAANGSMRDALSLLDQSIAFGNGKILIDDVKNMLGSIDSKALYAILQALTKNDANQLLQSTEQLAEQAIDFASALADLLAILHQIAVLQLVPRSPLSNPLDDELNSLAQQLTREDVQLYYQIGLMGQRDLSYAPTPRSGFEMILLRMLAFTPHKNKIDATATTAVITSITSPSTLNLPHDTQSWIQLSKLLSLTGATQALADQCTFKAANDHQLQLLLQRKHAPLLQASRVEKINQALKQFFNKEITVTVELIDQRVEKSEQSAEPLHTGQQKTAEQAILNDQKVQRIMQTFDAKLIKQSVIPGKQN